MKLSTVIKELQKALEAHGDMEVVQGGWDDWNHWKSVNVSAHVADVKPYRGGYVPVSCLETGGFGGP